MSAPVHWSQIPPWVATKLQLPDPDIIGPTNSLGEPCWWPWEPQQLKDAPIGQYHCPYCGDMAVAGIPHPDYTGEDLGALAADVADPEEPRWTVDWWK